MPVALPSNEREGGQGVCVFFFVARKLTATEFVANLQPQPLLLWLALLSSPGQESARATPETPPRLSVPLVLVRFTNDC